MDSRQVDQDFDRARHRAFINELRAILRRETNELIPYHEVSRRMSAERQSYRGLQEVPIAQIVGSEDRFRDFDRAFLPKRDHTAGRWKSIDRAYRSDIRLPPIQLYKVGAVYFVKDGNHRVSVARERGVEFIDAEVIESHIRLPLHAAMPTKDLLMQVEYAEFLRRSNLDRLRPAHDIRPTALGRYDEIWDQIELHAIRLREQRGGAVTTDEAVASWYDTIYLPIIRVVRERGILKRFSGRSEADVYLWIVHHREDLEIREGHAVSPKDSAIDYAVQVEAQHVDAARVLRGAMRLPSRFVRGLIPDFEAERHLLAEESAWLPPAGEPGAFRSDKPATTVRDLPDDEFDIPGDHDE
jgi:hypothetical protein